MSPLDALGLREDGDKGRKAETMSPRMDCVGPCIPWGTSTSCHCSGRDLREALSGQSLFNSTFTHHLSSQTRHELGRSWVWERFWLRDPKEL